MATYPLKGDGHRNGAIRDRSPVHNPKTDTWTKRDADTGRFPARRVAIVGEHRLKDGVLEVDAIADERLGVVVHDPVARSHGEMPLLSAY